MKKIISLVVVATMLFTLFAVNVSAAVPTKAEVVNTPAVDFEGYTEAPWTASPCYANAFNGVNTLVDDALFGQVLQFELTEGNGEHCLIGSVSGDAATLPDQYEVRFNMKIVTPGSAPIIVIRDPQHNVTASHRLAVLLATGGFEVGDWYEYKIVVDRTVTAFPDRTNPNLRPVDVYRRNITDGAAAWQNCTPEGNTQGGYQANAANKTVFTPANGGYRVTENTGGGSLGGATGAFISFGVGPYSVDPDKTAIGTKFQIDNIGVYSTKNYVSAGLIAEQDFEDSTNTRLTTDHGGNAKTYTLATEANGNTYAVLSGWTAFNNPGENFDIVQDDWSLTFDIYLTEAMNLKINNLYNGNASTTNAHILINSGELPAGKWLTCKACVFYNTSEGKWEYVVNYRDRGSNDAWTKINHYATANQDTGAKTFCFTPTGSANYYLDNVVLSRPEFISFPGIAVEDNTLNVGVAYEELIYTRTNQIPSFVPILATFNDNVLVDVDFETLTHDAGYIEVELSADATDADKAELYIWRNFDYSSPIMDAAYDLSSYLQ